MIYYLYRHIRLDTNEPFYIGIGTKEGRYSSYETEYRRAFDFKKRNNWWKKINKKTEIQVEILFHSDNYDFIKEKEKEFIILYKTTLCNLTEGGEGCKGYKHSEESKKKMSISHKGKILNDNQKEALRKGRRFIKGSSKSLKEIERVRILGAKRTSAKDKSLKQLHISNIGKKRTEETREKMSAWQIGKPKSEETKNRIRQSLKNRALINA